MKIKMWDTCTCDKYYAMPDPECKICFSTKEGNQPMNSLPANTPYDIFIKDSVNGEEFVISPWKSFDERGYEIEMRGNLAYGVHNDLEFIGCFGAPPKDIRHNKSDNSLKG